MIITADEFRTFSHMGDDRPLYEGALQIAAKWTDSRGSLCYTAYQTVTSETGGPEGHQVPGALPLDRSGTVLEGVHTPVQVFDPSAFPATLDTTSSSYSLYYRGADYSPRRVLFGDMWSEPAQE